MTVEDKISIDIYKVVTRAIAESDNLENMANQLTQLLTGALEIKGCTIFVLNPETDELETLGSFGLSIKYMNKGPLMADKSIGCTLRGEAIAISDVTQHEAITVGPFLLETGHDLFYIGGHTADGQTHIVQVGR